MLLRCAGISVERAVPHLPRVAAEMLKFCEAEAAGVRASSLIALRERNNLCAAWCLTPRPAPQISEGLQVLPGVEALLVALAARANCVTGLVRLVRVRRR